MNNLKVLEILGRIPLFQHMTIAQRKHIVAMPKAFEVYEEKDVIVTEGVYEPFFYILLSGEVDVIYQGQNVAHLKPPQFVGEVGFICREPRIATVIASTRCLVMKLDSENFRELPIKIREAIKDKIILGLAGRIKQFNGQIAQMKNVPHEVLSLDGNYAEDELL